MNNDFIEIVKAAQSGDDKAFEALYNMTKDSAYFIALSITKNEHDALDIIQDSYIKAFKSISTLNTPELFDNWLNSIVANTGKNYIKKKKPMLFADMENDAPVEWNEEEFNKDYLPQEAMDIKETSRLLMEIINELSEDRRLCILMYYYQDMSVKEIAEVLDLPVSNVKYKLLSARAEIKKGVEALEEKDTKLYGIFPFMLFPALFKSMQKEFSALHLSPQYSQLSLSVSGLQAQSAAGKAVKDATEETAKEVAKDAAKKGFFSTLAGKAAIIAATAFIAGGIITAAVIATNSSDDKKSSGSLNDSDNTNNNISQEEIKNTNDNNVSDNDSKNNLNIEDFGLFDSVIELDGVVYTLPCDFSEFEKNGWHFSDNSMESYNLDIINTIIQPDDSTLYYGIVKDDYIDSYADVGISFANTGSEPAKITELPVGSFRVDVKVKSQNPGPVIKFPGGVVIDQKTTSKDIIDKYGEPDWYYDGVDVMMEYWNEKGKRPGIFEFTFKNEPADKLENKNTSFKPENMFVISYDDFSYFKEDE